MDKEITKNGNEEAHKVMSEFFHHVYGTDGEVSYSIDAKLTLADGTIIDVWAYKLEDSQADPFYISHEKLKRR